MGFKNDSVYRTRRILCLVIFVLLLSIIVVCISIACRGTCANHGDSHGPVSATPSAVSTFTPQPETPTATQSTETPAPSDGIPLVVTEGDMSAVMARLEQLKHFLRTKRSSCLTLDTADLTPVRSDLIREFMKMN